MQHDVACAVAFKPFVGNRRTGNVTAQTFELMALMGGTVDVGVQAEAVFGGHSSLVDCTACAETVFRVKTFWPARGPSAIR